MSADDGTNSPLVIYEDRVRAFVTRIIENAEEYKLRDPGNYKGPESWTQEERDWWTSEKTELRELARNVGKSDEDHNTFLRKTYNELKNR